MKRLTVSVLLLVAITGCNGRSSTVGPTPLQTKAIGLSGNLAFGSVALGSTATATLTVSNTGGTALTVTSISYPPGFTGAWSGTVPAGGSQGIPVTFGPSAATAYGGTVAVTSDATAGTNTITASGTGTSQTTKTIGLRGVMAFGNLNVGTTATATLTVNNSGSAPLTVTGINYPAGFTGAWSGAVAPGGSQPVTVTFAPTAEATYGGTVTVTSDATGGVNTIGASGTGTTVTTTRVIGLSGVLAFGNVYVGTTSTATLTISNTGNAPLSVTGINYPIGFSGVWNGVVPAGGSQAVTVAFAPAAPMSYGGTITVTSDASGGVNTIAASGAGTSTVTTRAIGLSGVLAFGSVTVGTPATATLTISNTGNAPLVVTGISYPTGFSGAWGGPVPAGGSQPVTVTFTPTTATTYGGSVTVTSDATAGTNTIAISGIGTPPTTTDLTGTWSGTYTIVGVAGGECVGEIYRGPQGILNQPLAFRLTMTQNGSALSAIATDPGLTLSSDYTGAWAPTSPIPLSSSGGSPTGVSFTCSASAERSVQFASGLINLTITGDRSAVGTITANYNVLDSVTQANLATMIVTANFTVAR